MLSQAAQLGVVGVVRPAYSDVGVFQQLSRLFVLLFAGLGQGVVLCHREARPDLPSRVVEHKLDVLRRDVVVSYVDCVAFRLPCAPERVRYGVQLLLNDFVELLVHYAALVQLLYFVFGQNQAKVVNCKLFPGHRITLYFVQ